MMQPVARCRAARVSVGSTARTPTAAIEAAAIHRAVTDPDAMPAETSATQKVIGGSSLDDEVAWLRRVAERLRAHRRPALRDVHAEVFVVTSAEATTTPQQADVPAR